MNLYLFRREHASGVFLSMTVGREKEKKPSSGRPESGKCSAAGRAESVFGHSVCHGQDVRAPVDLAAGGGGKQGGGRPIFQGGRGAAHRPPPADLPRIFLHDVPRWRSGCFLASLPNHRPKTFDFIYRPFRNVLFSGSKIFPERWEMPAILPVPVGMPCEFRV
jgi:hypothetical protein